MFLRKHFFNRQTILLSSLLVLPIMRIIFSWFLKEHMFFCCRIYMIMSSSISHAAFSTGPSYFINHMTHWLCFWEMLPNDRYQNPCDSFIDILFQTFLFLLHKKQIVIVYFLIIIAIWSVLKTYVIDFDWSNCLLVFVIYCFWCYVSLLDCFAYHTTLANNMASFWARDWRVCHDVWHPSWWMMDGDDMCLSGAIFVPSTKSVAISIW